MIEVRENRCTGGEALDEPYPTRRNDNGFSMEALLLGKGVLRDGGNRDNSHIAA